MQNWISQKKIFNYYCCWNYKFQNFNSRFSARKCQQQKEQRIRAAPENRVCSKHIGSDTNFFEKSSFRNCLCGEMSKFMEFCVFHVFTIAKSIASFARQTNWKLTRTLNWHLIRCGLCGAISSNKLHILHSLWQTVLQIQHNYHCSGHCAGPVGHFSSRSFRKLQNFSSRLLMWLKQCNWKRRMANRSTCQMKSCLQVGPMEFAIFTATNVFATTQALLSNVPDTSNIFNWKVLELTNLTTKFLFPLVAMNFSSIHVECADRG